MMARRDPFGALAELRAAGETLSYYRLSRLSELGVADIDRLPITIKILLENLLRRCDDELLPMAEVEALARWAPRPASREELGFLPARVLLQDFTGIPVVADLAALQAEVARQGGDPRQVNPAVPVDLVIDHSVQVDAYGTADAYAYNVGKEYERNGERYAFLRWAEQAFNNVRVVPPGAGIVHQVNLEFLASVVRAEDGVAMPDTLVGTDSHTTMINGLGVLGWGVGGIEAEAAMLNQPLPMLAPDVVGVRVSGKLREGMTATDLVLTATQMLRAHGVVGKFVEFFGPGLSQLSLPDRATIANMAPEYGATVGFFPVDAETVRYLSGTGRDTELVEQYTRAQGMFREDTTPEPVFTDVLDLNLDSIEPSLAGPKRPQDRVTLSNVPQSLRDGYPEQLKGAAPSQRDRVGHGSVVIAAITSCTNTSNPAVMLGAGLLAKKAVERGLSVPAYVKTSLAPGSRVVVEYLQRVGVMTSLEALRFNLAGFGCTTCIGNSGPLPDDVAKAIDDEGLVVSAVLSGNRNFEGRVHAQVRAAYLASPPLVVAYALAGRVDIDLTKEPLGMDRAGQPVMLAEIWPSSAEVARVVESSVGADIFRTTYAHVFEGDERWRSLPAPTGALYEWDTDSTYLRQPPFVQDLPDAAPGIVPIRGARLLAMLGDSITTDHISPAGNIAKNSPAAAYLTEHGVPPADFNSYGSRRGNHEVMMRGTFANVRLRNELALGTEGGVTRHLPDGEVMPIHTAALRYEQEGVPLIVIAGKEYGSGSSRDWAAKGVALLGVRAVIAESYERIHRSNLIGMGVLPLEFLPGQGRASLNVVGEETYEIEGLGDVLRPRQQVTVRARSADGGEKTFPALVRIDNLVEIQQYRHGGILPMIVRRMLGRGNS